MAQIFDVIKAAAKIALSEAEVYNSQLVSGPFLNRLTGAPYESQLPVAVRMMRSGDCLLTTLRALPSSLVGEHAAQDLEKAMTGLGARAIFQDRGEGFRDVEHVHQGITALMRASRGEQPQVITAELVRLAHDQEAPYSRMWAPLSESLSKLLEANQFGPLLEIVKGLPTVEDDNDLGCVLSRAQSTLMGEYLDSKEEKVGRLAFALLVLDNQVMGAEVGMSYEEYIAFEESRHLAVNPQPHQSHSHSPGF